MTRFPVATVTAQFFTLHAVRVIAAFCNGLTSYRHAHARNALVMQKIRKNYHYTNNLFEISKAVTDDLSCNNTKISLTKE